MPLGAGDKLGPYEVVAPLGAGGMGEVYKARDTRLDRSVAVKVLPDHIAQREDARTRFEREARAVASLNHPNICTLYDIGPNYMVMELIEGETLAARIERGAIPLDQAIKLAIQIADALDRAHRAGVTHRDVKPHNIMLTRDGVKVLDFGLAKSAPTAPGPTEATLTKVLTTEGTVLGTPQYMAPEQFAGQEADSRSDIWAFGAVLYEMVTGRKAFHGSNYQSLVGAILATEPAPMAINPFTPPWLERLVRRCLQKDPEERCHCMRDIVLELKSPPAETPDPVAKPRWLQSVTAAFVLAAIAGWAAWAWVYWLRKPGEVSAPVRWELNPPDGKRLVSVANFNGAGGLAISPDGGTLAFTVEDSDGGGIHVRPMDALDSRKLSGTEGAGMPFWSPDSKWIAFVAQGKLKKIAMAGGVPVTLCDAGPARGGTWSEEGVILFGSETAGLQRVPASGGTPAAATRLNEPEGVQHHYYPQFLPGGRQFLYLILNQDEKKTGIAVGSLDNVSSTFLIPSPNRAIYDPAARRILYMNDAGALMTQRLELNPPRLSGEASPVAEGIPRAPFHRYADVSVSANGTLFYSQSRQRSPSRTVWYDRTGKPLEAAGGEPVIASGLRLSPDGKQVAYVSQDRNGPADVWVRNIVSGASSRITFQGGSSPHWSSDGKYLYYGRGRSFFRKPADGSGDEERICGDCGRQITSLSADGKFLLFGTQNIGFVPLEGEAKPMAWLATDVAEGYGTFSPDSRWVAYNSGETGRLEIYVQGFPEKRGKWMVSRGGGSQPKWRADGKELYWAAPGGEWMAAPIDLQPSVVRAGKPEVLFRQASRFTSIQPSGDGRRFLTLEPIGELREPPMVVVMHWAAGLEK